jgi:hypothetical protein
MTQVDEGVAASLHPSLKGLAYSILCPVLLTVYVTVPAG